MDKEEHEHAAALLAERLEHDRVEYTRQDSSLEIDLTYYLKKRCIGKRRREAKSAAQQNPEGFLVRMEWNVRILSVNLCAVNSEENVSVVRIKPGRIEPTSDQTDKR
jgi:hypothetical protein